jgi:hypothetical protein
VYGLDMLNTDSGARSAAPGAVLVLVEGEFNALSIWQVLHDPGPWAVPPAYHLAPVDVLSFGSESGSRARDLPEVAAGYERAVVWADRHERAAEGAALLRGHGIQAIAVSSPGGADANDLLRAGLLVEFLVLALTSAEGQ